MDRPVRERSGWFSFFRSRRRGDTTQKPEQQTAPQEVPQEPEPETRKAAPAIGIDLGTTFTAVSYVFRGEAKVIQNNEGHEITPSVVHFGEDRVLVGEEAVKRRTDSSLNTIFNIKRIIGRKHDDDVLKQQKRPFEVVEGSNGRACVRVGETIHTPEEISAIILRYMKTISQKVFFTEPTDAVITVPANFTNAQREATKEAGKLAGLNVLQIINEPTAAAIAFSVQNKTDERKRVLVFDLGGGTFDVSIVEIEGRKTSVLATDGLTFLGGSNFDERIYDEARMIYRQKGINIAAVDWTLMEACERAKKALSKRNAALISHIHHGGQGFELTYATFNDLCQDLFEKTLLVTDKVLSEAGLQEEDIDEILPVGGSTRVRRIREMLEERFPKEKIRYDTEPELAVAKGAAILAESLRPTPPDPPPKKSRPVVPPLKRTQRSTSESDEFSFISSLFSSSSSSSSSDPLVSLLDVAPFHLALRVDGDRSKMLIPKNTRIPFSTYDFCTNVEDDDTTLVVEILEGDDAQASNNETLAKVEIEIEPKPAGKNLIKVVLSIDVDGILTVTAIDMQTNKEVKVTIRDGSSDRSERTGDDDELPERLREHIRERLRDDFQEDLGELRDLLLAFARMRRGLGLEDE